MPFVPELMLVWLAPIALPIFTFVTELAVAFVPIFIVCVTALPLLPIWIVLFCPPVPKLIVALAAVASRVKFPASVVQTLEAWAVIVSAWELAGWIVAVPAAPKVRVLPLKVLVL
jgi:hypothetical protein